MHDVHSRPNAEIRVVDIDCIHVSRKKLRKLSAAKIFPYAMSYETGDQLPPITVEDCGDFFTVRDGRHRLQAMQRAGFTSIEVSIYN